MCAWDISKVQSCYEIAQATIDVVALYGDNAKGQEIPTVPRTAYTQNFPTGNEFQLTLFMMLVMENVIVARQTN